MDVHSKSSAMICDPLEEWRLLSTIVVKELQEMTPKKVDGR